MLKKISAALLLLVSSLALSATVAPIQLLNPAGSTSGQAIVSTGPSGVPAWANVAATALGAQAANTVVANATGSSAAPTAFAMPSCSTSASALNWTSGTGFTCNTAVNAAQLGGATFAAPGAIGGTTPAAGTFTTLRANSHAYVRADTPTSQVIATATNTVITNWSERSDAQSAFNPTTGVFTAPRTGKYQVSASVVYNQESYTAGQSINVIINKNGSAVMQALFSIQVTASVAPSAFISQVIDLSASDTVSIATAQNSGSNKNTLSTLNTGLTIMELP